MHKENATRQSPIDQLVCRIAASEERALAELFSNYGDRIFRYAFRITQQEQIAEEVTNDVMMAVWKGAHNFRGGSKLSTWLLGITRNLSINAIRGKSIATQDIDQSPEVKDVTQNSDARAQAKELALIKTLIRKSLRQLSLEHRDVLELTFFHECSYTEIAEIVGCPTSTVRTRMFYAKKQLQLALQNSNSESRLKGWLKSKASL